jgi:NAD-reducing hydrogenase large subunit
VNVNLSVELRDELRKDVDQITDWCCKALEVHKDYARAHAKLYREFAAFESSYMSLVGDHGVMDLYGGKLRVIDSEGQSIFDGVTPDKYPDYLAEEVRSWSYMKFPHIKSLGRENGWYRVGPLAQINCCDSIDTPLAEAARREFKQETNGKPVHSTLAYHWARLICIIHSVEKIKELLFDDDLQGTDLVVHGDRRFEGFGCIEAPRGTLFHQYKIDKNDQITAAHLLVATTSNNEAMNRSVKQVAMQYLSGKEITEGLLNHVEVAIRAYDPCLSCATHAMGQMPLVATLEDASGTVISRCVRQ